MDLRELLATLEYDQSSYYRTSEAQFEPETTVGRPQPLNAASHKLVREKFEGDGQGSEIACSNVFMNKNEFPFDGAK